MLYRNLLTLLTVIGVSAVSASAISISAHAQTRVHDLLQERQNQAREYLSQDIDSRGEFVKERSETLRQQENTSIAISRNHDADVAAIDRTYDAERQKYKNLPEPRRQNVQRAYEVHRAGLINKQRQEMSCALMAIQQGGNAANCGRVAFDSRTFTNELRDAANGATVQAPQGSGTLQPRQNVGVRIGDSGNRRDTSSSGGRVNPPTPPVPVTPAPHYGGSSGGSRGGTVNEYHYLQMQ